MFPEENGMATITIKVWTSISQPKMSTKNLIFFQAFDLHLVGFRTNTFLFFQWIFTTRKF